MPRDTDLSDSDSLTMRQKLEGMASNFERREKAIDRRHALTEFLADSNYLHRAALAELQKLRDL